jgi:TolB-like protein/class 3 adenylate cyclase
MAEEVFKRKLAAILSADVEGYSRLMDDDEEATVRTLTAYRTAIADLVQKFRGRIVDTPGDNILAEFTSVVDSVNCAAEIQRDIAERNAELPDSRRMEFRIGVNLGDVIEEEGRIYGDGVNIAARLEGLADAGGICISGTAFDQVKGKLSLGYQFVGEQTVKNIPDPVRAYKVLMDEKDAGKLIGVEKKAPKSRWMEVAAIVVFVVIGLIIYQVYVSKQTPPVKEASAEKASIAVLPFDNMSTDPEQEYFGDGISEDLITDLSKIPDLLVISRLSSFTYKGKSVKTQQIGEELGVRYVLEGSVRKANGDVRINAQLIDAATGHHLWAERYDGNTNDIFALQDKITRKIAASLAVKLTQEDQKRLTQKGTTNMEAYEAYLKGATIAYSLRNNVDKFVESLPWFEKAIKLDPDYSLAYAALAETYLFGIPFGLHRKLEISPRISFLRGTNYLQMAMKNPSKVAYRTAARVYGLQREHQKSIEYGMKAIDFGPNEYRSNAFMVIYLNWAGRPDESFAFAERMRRADPACLF